MLGSVSDAEDVLQEAHLRFGSMVRARYAPTAPTEPTGPEAPSDEQRSGRARVPIDAKRVGALLLLFAELHEERK
jgi:hypothetical protein